MQHFNVRHYEPGYVQNSIPAGVEVSGILVAVLQVEDLRIVRFLDAGRPVDPLFRFHAEADVVGGVDLQRLRRRSELESWDALDVNVSLKEYFNNVSMSLLVLWVNLRGLARTESP